MKKVLFAISALALAGTSFVNAEHLKSLDAKGLSETVKPSEDFYLYVNQAWLDANPLTPEYSRYGQFNVLTDSSENRVKRIVTGLADKKPQKGTNAYLIATLY